MKIVNHLIIYIIIQLSLVGCNSTYKSEANLTCMCILSPTSTAHDTYLIEVNGNGVIKTSFGLYVRSKSELQIAELLYSLGIEFYYEKARHLWEGTDEYASRTVYPDFTIVLPDDREIYWEHKGMLSDAMYVERDINKEIIYNLNGIYQPHNLIVTAEGPNNEFDMEAVRKIAEGVLLPMMAI